MLLSSYDPLSKNKDWVHSFVTPHENQLLLFNPEFGIWLMVPYQNLRVELPREGEKFDPTKGRTNCYSSFKSWVAGKISGASWMNNVYTQKGWLCQVPHTRPNVSDQSCVKVCVIANSYLS